MSWPFFLQIFSIFALVVKMMTIKMRHFAFSILFVASLICSCRPDASNSAITAEMAFEGVSNYCHDNYDWSVAEDNPTMMSLEMGEESDSAYQVVFRSYTGAVVYFYVGKVTGATRMVEHVPALGITGEVGTIDLLDYLEQAG